MSTCSGIRADGEPCSVRPMVGKQWCINHSPDAEVIKLATPLPGAFKAW
jgi:hypothetical protein